jgi:uncharacterized protein (DUF4415 family)
MTDAAAKRKQKVSLSLDADLVQELKARGPLSPQVNEAIRSQLRPGRGPSRRTDD